VAEKVTVRLTECNSRHYKCWFSFYYGISCQRWTSIRQQPQQRLRHTQCLSTRCATWY